MLFSNDFFYVTIDTSSFTMGKQGVSANKDYPVIGADNDRSQFWFIDDFNKFELIPMHMCKFSKWRTDEYNQRGVSGDNVKSDGEDELLGGITKSKGRKPSTTT